MNFAFSGLASQQPVYAAHSGGGGSWGANGQGATLTINGQTTQLSMTGLALLLGGLKSGNLSVDALSTNNITEEGTGSEPTEEGMFDSSSEGGQGQDKSKNSQKFYFGSQDGTEDKIAKDFFNKLPVKDNTVTVLGHGSSAHISDRSGLYVGQDYRMESPQDLHDYLYLISSTYKNAIDNNTELDLLLLVCQSARFGKELSKMHPNLNVMGVDGFLQVGYDKGNQNTTIIGVSTDPQAHDHLGRFNVYRGGLLINQFGSRHFTPYIMHQQPID